MPSPCHTGCVSRQFESPFPLQHSASLQNCRKPAELPCECQPEVRRVVASVVSTHQHGTEAGSRRTDKGHRKEGWHKDPKTKHTKFCGGKGVCGPWGCILFYPLRREESKRWPWTGQVKIQQDERVSRGCRFAWRLQQ